MSSKTKATTINGEAKPAPVPKLRFPEFRKAEGWESKRLGDLCELITKGSTPTSYGFDYVDSGIRFVKIESLSGGLVDRSKTAYISEDCHASFFRSQLNENDILFSIAGALGVIALVDRDILPANVNQAVGIVRLKNGYSHQFLLHQLQGNLVQAEIQRIRAGAAQPNISLSQLGDFATLLPNEAEQQKIAECLSSLDELIAAQARKVDALKTHKKGLMQQLFPREGETQPRLRFPEFQNGGEWKETRLGQLGTLVSGLTYSPDDVRESGLLVLRSSNVQNGEIVLEDCIYVDPSIKGANLSQPNDILICVRNGSKALIGKCALIPDGMPLCTHGAFMTVFRAQIPNFVFQLFQTDRYQKQVAGDLGATINSINGGQLLKYEFFVPKPPEQERIASFLTSLDALIRAETQKLEGLKTDKKGLMQQLFPSPEEVEA